MAMMDYPAGHSHLAADHIQRCQKQKHSLCWPLQSGQATSFSSTHLDKIVGGIKQLWAGQKFKRMNSKPVHGWQEEESQEHILSEASQSKSCWQEAGQVFLGKEFFGAEVDTDINFDGVYY